jgi:hypothetical protein
MLVLGLLVPSVGPACAGAARASEEAVYTGNRFVELPAITIAEKNEARLLPPYGTVRYPEAERAQSIEAEFADAYVLDTAGMPEPRTITIVGDAAPAFLSAACQWIGTRRFEPVARNGVATRALVVRGVKFGIDGPRVTHGVPTRRVREDDVRRRFVAQGVARSAQELERSYHCF